MTPEPVRMFEPESNPGISDMGHFSGQLNANAQSFRGYNPFGGGMGWNYGNGGYNPLGNQNIKLPKLQLKYFSGDPMKWLEFWESFERNVHCNNAYSDVHKMSYLKACLDGAASTTIANLSIIGENYKPAVDVLKAKYGQTSILKGAHMAALKRIQGVTNSRELNKLRKLYDDIDSHYKALLVLGVQGEHYSVATKPDLMRKIPWDIVINIRRSKEINHEWTIAEFLEQLWKERASKQGLYSDCRCEQEKGNIKKKSGHHVSTCNPKETTVTTARNLHDTEKGAIAFQTVQARISVPGKPSVPCRMLLDTGSDRTYMLQKVANQLQARPVRYETKILDTVHGTKTHKCAIYDLEVRDMEGKIQFTTEAGTSRSQMSSEIEKLWDLEAVGIREDDEAHLVQRYSCVQWNKICSRVTLEIRIAEEFTSRQQEASLNQKESQSKVLGIKWDTGDDVMTIELVQIAEEKDTGLTKREILSLLSRIYDPLGVVGSLTIVARKIFQDICKEGTNWDSTISGKLTAARVASRLMTRVKVALEGFEIKASYMWTDSCTVLHWIQGRGQYKLTESIAPLIKIQLTWEREELRQKDRIKTSYLNTAELKRTETAWIKEVQSELETQGNYQQLTPQLNIVKVDEILRCEGRLQFSRLSYDTQSPILLPRRHRFTELVVLEAHTNAFHWGSDELEDIPITPNHMIFGYALPTIAGDLSEIIEDDEDYLFTVNRRLKYIATIKANMWRRWTREYIQGLQEYQRHNLEKGKIPEIGEIVLIVDSRIKQRNWRMGKVNL
eukprot:gene19549-21481_t